MHISSNSTIDAATTQQSCNQRGYILTPTAKKCLKKMRSLKNYQNYRAKIKKARKHIARASMPDTRYVVYFAPDGNMYTIPRRELMTIIDPKTGELKRFEQSPASSELIKTIERVRKEYPTFDLAEFEAKIPDYDNHFAVWLMDIAEEIAYNQHDKGDNLIVVNRELLLGIKRQQEAKTKATQRPLTFTRSTSLPRTRQRSRHTAVKRSCVATTGQDNGDPDQGDPPGSPYCATLTLSPALNINISQLFHAHINPGHCCVMPLGGEAA